ncbi:MAG: PilT/PilU family type 4a pilus ATPase [Thermoguttaceae bacterium]|jgi:twitching motility protein PilT
MCHSQGEEFGAAATPSNEDDLSAALLKHLALQEQELEVDKLFRALVKLEGSDLHMRVGSPPMIRSKGELRALNRGPIDASEMVRLLVPMMDARCQKIFRKEGGVDFSYSCDVEGTKWRFRVNVLTQLGSIGLVARRINNWIPDFEGLHLPPAVEQLCNFDQGLVLLAGVTGSGKTTTIAAMLNYINRKYRKHILTLEDPIEFIYTPDKCLINQREVGHDVEDFAVGMKHAVREDPDVMLVGEMRDENTFMTAIHAAETGHLVFATIHASSAATTIGRILDLFPVEAHASMRSAIAFNTRGIVAQKLLKSFQPDVGRVPAVEIMFFGPLVQKLVLEGKDEKLPDAIRIGADEGMQDFTMSLKKLVEDELVDRNTAFSVAPNQDALKMALKGIDVRASGIL